MAAVAEFVVPAGVAGVVVLLARFLINYLHFRKLELAIPGPPSLFLLGNALDFVFVTADTSMRTILRMVGGRREMCRFSVFNNLMVAVQDPEQLEELLRCKKFDDKSAFFYELLNGYARGLVSLNGAEWKAQRKWLEPAFNLKVLNSFVDVFSEEARNYVDRVEVDKEVDVAENLRKAAVRNNIRTSMSSDAAEYEGVAMDAFEFIEIFLRTITSRSHNPILWSDRVFAWTPQGKRVQKHKQIIDNHCSTFIAKKRVELENQSNDCNLERARKTLVDIMLDVPDPSTGMPRHVGEDVIIHQIKGFFGANVETTVSTVTWTLKVLSMLPEVQERVHAELVSVFGDSDRGVSNEDLPKLEYLTRVIKETLRMFPPAPFVMRQCYEETELCGHTIPAGTTLFVNIFAAHRDPKHWDKPEEFDPDRFLPERSKDRHPYAYLPFSTGPRKCIGGKYAMINLTILLATTLRAFKVLPVGDHKDLQSLADNISADLSSHLVGGTRVKFHRRGAKAA